MCGIAGLYNFNNQINKEKFNFFLDELKHRGPNAKGVEYFKNDSLALGHRRLSILDLSEKGTQPMFDENNEYCIVFNGEIYNFLELREELKLIGYSFYSDTDTEVVINAYKQWGLNCLDKFNGMWAFAIYDLLNEEMILARDRFGVKPLYYTHQENHFFAFSSETKSFSKLENFAKKINYNIVKFTFENPYYLEGNGYTIFDDIYQLLPGHYLKIKNKKVDEFQTRWYDINEKISIFKGDFKNATQIIKELFENACKIRLRADVPIASALSGGLDSSSVYCMVNKILSEDNNIERINNNNRKAITVSFPDTELDELNFAEKVIQKYESNNWVISKNSDTNLESEIINDTKSIDALTSNPISSIYKIYEAVKNQDIVISLDGHGVDEMMYGYRYTLENLFYFFIEKGNYSKANFLKEILINLYHDEAKNKASERFDKSLSTIKSRWSRTKLYIKNLFINKKRINPIKSIPQFKTLTKKPYNFSNYPLEKKLLLDDFFIYSLPTFLRDFDRASMAHHIEVRMPFMDYRLVEMVFSLPTEFLLNNGKTKFILREAMKGIVPSEIIERTYKVGIQSPTVKWFYDGFYSKTNEFLNLKEFEELYLKFYDIDYNLLKNNFADKKLIEKEISKIWNIINLYLISNHT